MENRITALALLDLASFYLWRRTVTTTVPVGHGFGRRVVVRVCRWVWMVVRFVCVFRVPVCARVSRACPVCVPAPPVSFYR